MNDQEQTTKLVESLEIILDRKIKEAHLIGKTEGEKTNSNLVDMILHKMEAPIEKAIEKHVNGKIKAIDVKFDAYIIEDLKWKERAMPILEAGTKAMNFGTVGMIVLKFVGTLGVATAFIYAFFKWVR